MGYVVRRAGRLVKRTLWVQRLLVIEAPLAAAVPTLESLPRFAIRTGRPHDWEILGPFLAAAYGDTRVSDGFRTWLARPESRICFLGFLDGELVYNSWIALSDYYDGTLGLVVHVGEGEAFAVAGYTAPEARGRKMHRIAHAHLLRRCQQLGLKRVYWYMTPRAHASGMSAYESVGFRQQAVGKVLYLRLPGYRRLLNLSHQAGGERRGEGTESSS
jgi:GNAT superfamily N-acetyltransferase